MKIALDYDDTYTRDPGLWDHFIRMAEHCGHEVVCVTARFTGTEPLEHEMIIPVFYCGRKAKHPHMLALGHEIDVWIDDMPERVHMDHETRRRI